MNIEDELHNVGPALDRAIDKAAERVSRSVPSARGRNSWSRPRAAMAALAAAAVAAAVIGVVAHLDAGDRGVGVETRDTVTVATTVASTVPPTTTTAATTTTEPVTTTQPGVALRSVDWSSVSYPFAPDCGQGFNPPVSVGQVAYATPAPDVSVAVVQVRCNVGAGTPPVVLYVYDRAPSTSSPHLMETLVHDTDGWQAGDFTVLDDGSISQPVAGFSSNSLPNCCPDVRAVLLWRWTGSDYRLVSAVPPHLAYPWN